MHLVIRPDENKKYFQPIITSLYFFFLLLITVIYNLQLKSNTLSQQIQQFPYLPGCNGALLVSVAENQTCLMMAF